MVGIIRAVCAACLALAFSAQAISDQAPNGRLAYLVSDLRIPFWDIMWRGVRHKATALEYDVRVYSAENSSKRELELAVAAIKDRVDGIVLSPTDSSAAVTVLKLAEAAGIPVVIADVGTESGEYVSYISSDNHRGSYALGQLLVAALREKRWDDGSVGIVAIPQKRTNGKARTAGFMQALTEGAIRGGGIRQQVDFSYEETFELTRELIQQDPAIRAIWLQGSDRYQGALDAIAAEGKAGQILLLCFDAEPEFLDMIPEGVLLAAGMQQPFLMGEKAVSQLVQHLNGQQVPSETQTEVLAVSAENIRQHLPIIRRNVLGLETD